MLYAIRLCCRVEAFARFLLASDRAAVTRGLKPLPSTVASLRIGASALRSKLEDHALPVMQGWYARLRAQDIADDACTVAAHMASIFAPIDEDDLDARCAARLFHGGFTAVTAGTGRSHVHVHVACACVHVHVCMCMCMCM